jgi:signal transduction histidine kinase
MRVPGCARSVRVMPAPLNVVIRALGYAWIGILMFGLYPPTAPHALVIQVAAYILGCLGVAAWWLIDLYPPAARRRARLLPAALGLIAVAAGCAASAGGGGLALMVFGFLAAMWVASDCGLVAGLTVALAGVLAAEVVGLTYGAGFGSYIGYPLAFTSAFVIGRNIGRVRASYRIQAEQAAELLAQREQAEAERRRADLLAERARIAREIHDVLAHSLGALGIQIQASRLVLTDRGDIGKADELLAAAQKMAAEGLSETRRALHALRTDMLPLGEELARATGTYAERYRVKVGVHSEGTPRPVPPDATVALLRIAQEAVVNAAKHAAGQPVKIRLAYEPAEVRLTVTNDLTAVSAENAGTALVSTADTGYGLTGMRERLRLLNGTLETARRDGQWVVTVQLPVPAP